MLSLIDVDEANGYDVVPVRIELIQDTLDISVGCLCTLAI